MAAKLREAAGYADDPMLKRYPELRAEALLTDEYRASDMAWLDMKDDPIDVVSGRSRRTSRAGRCSASNEAGRGWQE